MKEFESYSEDLGFEIGSGFSHNPAFMKIKDERNKRTLMEKQYEILNMQRKEIQEQQAYRELHRNEILAQQQYRKEQKAESKRMFYISVATLIFSFISLIISIFK